MAAKALGRSLARGFIFLRLRKEKSNDMELEREEDEEDEEVCCVEEGARRELFERGFGMQLVFILRDVSTFDFDGGGGFFLDFLRDPFLRLVLALLELIGDVLVILLVESLILVVILLSALRERANLGGGSAADFGFSAVFGRDAGGFGGREEKYESFELAELPTAALRTGFSSPVISRSRS